MPTLAQVQAAIKTKLAAVSNVGRVHDYERYSTRIEDLRGHYFDAVSARLKGWYFRRERTAELDHTVSEVRRLTRWHIRGYLAVDDADASETIMQNLVEAICTAFRTDRTLGGLISDLKDMERNQGPAGIQVERVAAAVLAGVLCHEAVLSLTTEHLESSI